MTARRRTPRALEALRHRDFRLLFTGQAISAIGDAAFVTALGWTTYTLAGSAKLGIVLLCQALAVLTTLLIGGALADRLPRRKLMIASDLIRFTAVAALAAVDASGHLTFPLLAFFAVLVGLGDGLFYPAYGGMVPLLVEQPSIASANSLMGLVRWSSILIGPAFAGFLYQPLGSTAVFAADAVSFLFSAVFVYRTRPRALETAEREGTFREIASGARYVSTVPWLWVTIALFGVILMLQLAPQQVLMPKLVTTQWSRGIGAYALLTTLMGVGTVTGTLLFGQIQPRHRRGVISYVFWLVNSLAVVGIALSPWYPLAGALMVIRGVCVGFGVAIWETMLMELVPESLLSRVVSLDYFGSFGLMPLGLAFAAAVSGLAPPGTLIAVGAGINAVMLAVVLTRPWLRAVD
jgi:MFS family permease